MLAPVERRAQKFVYGQGIDRIVMLQQADVVEEFDGAGNWQAQYVHEDGIDQPRPVPLHRPRVRPRTDRRWGRQPSGQCGAQEGM
jgi:hypothetical protein